MRGGRRNVFVTLKETVMLVNSDDNDWVLVVRGMWEVLIRKEEWTLILTASPQIWGCLVQFQPHLTRNVYDVSRHVTTFTSPHKSIRYSTFTSELSKSSCLSS
ncbi:hypothetical protein Ocin01_05662 [Orchesella cincta]|uniref:Uncharacterized protein n=1 Tax=Orchesella cincta TaxID=48709 RepID=A0A1D2N6X8_ORCCI|nr:hypothetical protein Ocin01_05662 [Orchesella cincta]